MPKIYTVYPAPQLEHSMTVDTDEVLEMVSSLVERHKANNDHCLIRVFADYDGPTGEIFSHAYYCKDGRAPLWKDATIPMALF